MDRKKTNRTRLIGILFLQVVGWGVVTGCVEDGRRTETDDRNSIEVTCCLQIEPLVGEPATRRIIRLSMEKAQRQKRRW